MDMHFRYIILPHLLRGPWRSLETMVIRGVEWPADICPPQIVASRGKFVEFTICRRGIMMDHIGLGDPLAGVLR